MSFLPPTRELRVRLDTAQALTRLFYREQAVALACGGWIPRVAPLEHKAELAPDGLGVRARGRRAARARLRAALPVAVPRRAGRGDRLSRRRTTCVRSLRRWRDDYRAYLDVGDELADGPSIRIVESARGDKERQSDGARRPRARRRGSGPRRAVLRSPASTGPTCSTRRTRTARGSRSRCARRSAT